MQGARRPSRSPLGISIRIGISHFILCSPFGALYLYPSISRVSPSCELIWSLIINSLPSSILASIHCAQYVLHPNRYSQLEFRGHRDWSIVSI